MSIRDMLIAPRSPWQNSYVERLIGTIRRECLDHVIVFGEAHLRRILGRYAAYYNESRIHRSLDRNAPYRTRWGLALGRRCADDAERGSRLQAGDAA
jgi:transposase InsO family protein